MRIKQIGIFTTLKLLNLREYNGYPLHDIYIKRLFFFFLIGYTIMEYVNTFFLPF